MLDEVSLGQVAAGDLPAHVERLTREPEAWTAPLVPAGHPGGAPPASQILYRAGQTIEFEATDIHRVVHADGEPAVSVHAYSPPLDRMGSYVVEPGGALRRQSLGGADELRPLAAAS